MAQKITEFELPDFWASALINGDESGYTEKDLEEINLFLERHPDIGYCVGVGEESYFKYGNDGTHLGCNTSVFTFIKHTQ